MYTSASEVKITDTYKISYSYEILIKVADWLIKKDKLRREDCPIVVTKGKKRCLINVQSKHQDGGKFRQARSLSNDSYIETHYSTKDCEDYARRLLKKYGYPEDALEVKILKFGVQNMNLHTGSYRPALLGKVAVDLGKNKVPCIKRI